MTIKDRAEELVRTIDDVQRAQHAAGDVKALQIRIDDLQSYRERLMPIVEALVALKDRAEAGSLVIPFTAAETKAIRELRSSVDEKGSVALTEGELFKKATSALDRSTAQLRDAIRTAWRDYQQNCASPVSEDLITALETIPDFVGISTRLKRLNLSVKSKSQRDWLSPEELQDFDEDCRHLGEAWQELEGGKQIPSGVLNFLKLAAGEGAPLAALTAEVRDWLEEQDLAEGFTIRPADD